MLPKYTFRIWQGRRPMHVACRYLVVDSELLMAKKAFWTPKGTGVSLDSTTSLKACCWEDMTRSRDSVKRLVLTSHLK